MKPPLRCLHLISGDRWAGAEVSAFSLLKEMARRDDVEARALVFNEGELARALVDCGVATDVLPEEGRNLVALCRSARDRLDGWKPRIVHTHRYKENILGAMLTLSTQAAHVRTAHGLPPGPGRHSTRHYVAGLLDAALADWLGSTWIAVSTDLARRISGARRRVHIVPNGLPGDAPPPDRAGIERRFAGAGAAWYVGFAGRFEGVKRPDRFVELLARLPERIAGRQVRGVMLGDGSLHASVARQLSRHRMNGRVKLFGHCDDAERLVAALDALVIPSDHEGLPMVLLEAMRAGVPVVGTAVGGLAEALDDDAWVFPPDDVGAMARAVRRILGEADLHRRLADRQVARFRSHYEIGETTNAMLDVYREALAA